MPLSDEDLQILSPDFYLRNPDTVARELLGKILYRTLPNGTVLAGRINETEAYSSDDPASHSYGGKTDRNKAMFSSAGCLYVYLVYGIHYCLNVVTGPRGEGSAVLIRGMLPLQGIEEMMLHRGGCLKKNICNGPAKLCQALCVNLKYNYHDLSRPPVQILKDGCVPGNTNVEQTVRVGISKGVNRLRRFYIKNI